MSSGKCFDVWLTEADVRNSFHLTPVKERKKRGNIPRTGRWSPASLAICRTTQDKGWEVWDSMLVYHPSDDRHDYQSMLFFPIPAKLKQYIDMKIKGPFGFVVDTTRPLGGV